MYQGSFLFLCTHFSSPSHPLSPTLSLSLPPPSLPLPPSGSHCFIILLTLYANCLLCTVSVAWGMYPVLYTSASCWWGPVVFPGERPGWWVWLEAGAWGRVPTSLQRSLVLRSGWHRLPHLCCIALRHHLRYHRRVVHWVSIAVMYEACRQGFSPGTLVSSPP